MFGQTSAIEDGETELFAATGYTGYSGRIAPVLRFSSRGTVALIGTGARATKAKFEQRRPPIAGGAYPVAIIPAETMK
jgi:hypothetical protein